MPLKNKPGTDIRNGASRMRIERSTPELHPHLPELSVGGPPCQTYLETMSNSWSPSRARLAEWSKGQDLSSCNRKIAWVRTPHLADIFPSVLDVHNTVLLAILIGSSGAIG